MYSDFVLFVYRIDQPRALNCTV